MQGKCAWRRKALGVPPTVRARPLSPAPGGTGGLFTPSLVEGPARAPHRGRRQEIPKNYFGGTPRNLSAFWGVEPRLSIAKGGFSAFGSRKTAESPFFDLRNAPICPEKTSNHLAATSKRPRKTWYAMEHLR